MEEHIHKLTLNNRAAGLVTGVNEVVSFDPEEVVLNTGQGIMMIKGENLRVIRLTVEKGEAEFSGRVDGIIYTGERDGEGKKEKLLYRLFR